MMDVLLKRSVCGDMTIEMSKGFNRAAKTFESLGISQIVITSIRDGLHSPGSLHYNGNAVDLRLPPNIDTNKLINELKLDLGQSFDVVLESNHIHLEFDP